MGENRLKTNPAGAAGESYVLAELLRRGYIASTLYNCAKDYDLLAYHPDKDKYLKIQVKTSQSKSKIWKLGDKPPYYDNETFYVFVTMVGEEMPEYYIVDSKKVYEVAEKRHNIPTRSGTARTSGRKFKFEKDEEKQYKDWNILLGR